MLTRIYFLFVVMVTSVHAQVYSFGGCPDYKVKSNFNIDEFLGKWFMIYKYDNIFEYGGKCNTVTYSKNEGGSINVLNRMNNALTFFPLSREGTAYFSGRSDEGKLNMNVVFDTFFQIPLWILDTDYKNYAIVYSCHNLNFAKAEALWIMSRLRLPPDYTLDEAWNYLNNSGISTSQVKLVDQSFCFFS